MADLIVDEPSPGVTLVTMNRPEVKNALNMELLGALTETIVGLERGETRCIVLTGAGDAFSAGGDIREELSFDSNGFSQFVDRFGQLGLLLRNLAVPVIAAVNGWAIAGGFELAAQCDIRIVGEGPWLSVGDADVGLSPTSGLTWTLPRLVGLGNALYLTLASPRIDGDTAVRLGFAQETVRRERVVERALELATAIAAKPGIGVNHSKTLLQRAYTADLKSAVRDEHRAEMDCFAHPDVGAAFSQFIGDASQEEGNRR